MPWLLYRYLLGELLRVFALTASVLVLVIAFGAAIKPLAADDLIGPLQTAKYIMLAAVPMLQFALPFSAGFAATVVLHRMTADNEILAAAASGLSYPRLLLPVAGFGVLLLALMVLLTQWVIPRFWASMQELIAADVTRVVQSSIDKGMPVRFGDVLIHADRVMVQEDPPDTDADTRLVLLRVVAAELDGQGRIVTDVAARQAVVDVYRRDTGTYLKMVLADTVVFDGKTGQLASAPRIAPDRPLVVPGPLEDDPMFMTQRQILRLKQRPDGFSRVADAKERLARSLRELEAWELIERRIEAGGTVELIGGWGVHDHRLVVSADGFDDGRFDGEGARPVRVAEFDAGRLVRRIEAGAARVRRALGSTLRRPSLDLVMEDCAVTDLRSGGAVNHRSELTVPELSVSGLAAAGDPALLPWEDLLAEAQGRTGAAGRQGERLAYIVGKLKRELTSRLMRRYALSLTSLLLLLLGAVLAMWLRRSVPLTIYIWAFLPSIVDMLLISGGDHMIRSGLVISGTAVMWAGNGLLLVMLIWVLSRLMRN